MNHRMQAHTEGTGEAYQPTQPKIADRCPSCGAQSLFVGAGGWLTCGVIGCKNPCVSDAYRETITAAQRPRTSDAIQMVDGIARPVPWAGDRDLVKRCRQLDLLLMELDAWLNDSAFVEPMCEKERPGLVKRIREQLGPEYLAAIRFVKSPQLDYTRCRTCGGQTKLVIVDGCVWRICAQGHSCSQ